MAAYLSKLASRAAVQQRLDMLLLCELGRDDPIEIPGYVLYRGAARHNRSAFGAGGREWRRISDLACQHIVRK